MDTSDQIKSRKEDHINLSLNADVSVEGKSNCFEEFELVPTAVPSINFNDISLESTFLKHEFSAPIMIAGMTGGYPNAEKINKSLARIATTLNIPLGVGSQRSMIKDPSITNTYNVKSEYPDVFLVGNLGLVQFSIDFDIEHYMQAVEGINADAMAIHVNAFQELCQPEGDLDWRNSWHNLEKIIQQSPVPVIGKEVGSGIAWEEALRMEKMGIAAVDLGGAGGTSWAKIELLRNTDKNALSLTDDTLKWGISTALATYEATSKLNIPTISTGGMYDGLSAAKALAMGTQMVGIARPVLQQLVTNGETAAIKWLEHYILNIKRVMFLMGIDTVQDLRLQKHRIIPVGKARQWLLSRGFIEK